MTSITPALTDGIFAPANDDDKFHTPSEVGTEYFVVGEDGYLRYKGIGDRGLRSAKESSRRHNGRQIVWRVIGDHTFRALPYKHSETVYFNAPVEDNGNGGIEFGDEDLD